ncbi:MAG: 25S rRNA (adenine645-N1)-methyltransferase [Bogoriella megaspora]|nr:MAG: 25S rRNA (adenine645-N1)-methyltransferase [Bogoriella megaspora]
MFAVPGWSVRAEDLKTQTEAPKPTRGSDDSSHKKSKKRKRGSNGPAVTAENVGALWDQHLGGKPSKPSAKDKKRKNSSKQDEVGKDVANGGKAPERTAHTKPQDAETPSVKPHEAKTHEPPKNASKKSKKRKLSSNTPQQPIPHPSSTAPPPLPPTTKLTPLQAAMRQKLTSARFRHLNETLYTKPSSHALDLFSSSPEMFEEYHAGFRQQVAVWPENPVDIFVATIRERGAAGKGRRFGNNRDGGRESKSGGVMNGGGGGQGKGAVEPLPRAHPKAPCTIVDLGCGDASLAASLHEQQQVPRLNLRIQSFDLHAKSPLVTKADIADLPLASGSVDVAIFCLSLMGTNWLDFIDEAWRVLRWKGEVWIAEIKSRFGRVEKRKGGDGVDHSVGKKRKGGKGKVDAKSDEVKRVEEEDMERELAVEVDGAAKQPETDVTAFVDALRNRGFTLKAEGGVDLRNKMFLRMELVKAVTPTRGKNVPKQGEAEGQKDGGTWKKKPKAKFLEQDGTVDEEQEAKLLKPCVYKLR